MQRFVAHGDLSIPRRYPVLAAVEGTVPGIPAVLSGLTLSWMDDDFADIRWTG